MTLIPGAIDANGEWLTTDSMAAYIENAMEPAADPEDSGKAGRREFLIAIATGVIEYLKDHDGDGFVVHLPGGDTGSLEVRA
jgi:hypothetical protein